MSDIETRLAQIAWLVLAGAACTPAESASQPAAPSTVTLDVGAIDAAAPSFVAVNVEADAATTSTPPPPPPPPLANPQAVCAQYRAAAAADPNGPRAQTPTATRRASSWEAPGASDLQARRVDPSTVECRIVWERQAMGQTIMFTPSCCPQARMTAPCPGPSPLQVPGERAKEEVARVTNDGTRISSALAWRDWAQEPPRHMCGRRPEGFVWRAVASTTEIGACLAEMAELEAASIAAFDRLARELATLGAPQALVARARAAKRDEIRHARAMRSLARRFGARPRAGRVRARLPVRRAYEVALENAVEGCVHETFGAVLATFQAARAEDAGIRAALADIAPDERRHATLAWDVDAWLLARCTAEERREVEHARETARTLLEGAPPSMASSVRSRALGEPTRVEREALVRETCRLRLGGG